MSHTTCARRHRSLLGIMLCVIVPFCWSANAQEGRDATTLDLTKQALTHEKAGDWLKAAAAYEAMVEHDPTKEMVLSRRLVNVYAQAGVTNRTLHWARVVMKRNPHPRAYLAGVHAMLRNYGEAESILQKRIAEAAGHRQKRMLQWQLADVYEQAGDAGNAEKALQAAVELAAGKPAEGAARDRLEAFRERQKRKSAPTPGEQNETP